MSDEYVSVSRPDGRAGFQGLEPDSSSRRAVKRGREIGATRDLPLADARRNEAGDAECGAPADFETGS